MRFQWLRCRVSWAVVCSVLALCLVVSGVPAGSLAEAEPVLLQAAVVDIEVVPSLKTVNLNETFTLDIYVYPNGQPVDAVDADLTFNPAYLEVLSIIGEPWELPIELYSAFDNTKGTLTHSRGILQGTPPSSTFLLCSIELRARGVTAGTGLAFTDLTGAYSEGESVLDSTSDGTVVVTGWQLLLPLVFKSTASAGEQPE
jgi:hypothetical protein